MEIVSIIASVVFGGGLLAFFQWFFTRKQERRKKEAEAKTEEVSADKAGAETAVTIGEAYKDLLDRYEKRFEEQEGKTKALEVEVRTMKPKLCGKIDCLNREGVI